MSSSSPHLQRHSFLVYFSSAWTVAALINYHKHLDVKLVKQTLDMDLLLVTGKMCFKLFPMNSLVEWTEGWLAERSELIESDRK